MRKVPNVAYLGCYKLLYRRHKTLFSLMVLLIALLNMKLRAAFTQVKQASIERNSLNYEELRFHALRLLTDRIPRAYMEAIQGK